MKTGVRFISVLAMLIALSLPTVAKDIGIDFKSMKVGTAAHYVDSSGRKFIYTYKQKLPNHVMEKVAASKLVYVEKSEKEFKAFSEMMKNDHSYFFAGGRTFGTGEAYYRYSPLQCDENEQTADLQVGSAEANKTWGLGCFFCICVTLTVIPGATKGLPDLLRTGTEPADQARTPPTPDNSDALAVPEAFPGSVPLETP